jgi:hypothetical protein
VLGHGLLAIDVGAVGADLVGRRRARHGERLHGLRLEPDGDPHPVDLARLERGLDLRGGRVVAHIDHGLVAADDVLEVDRQAVQRRIALRLIAGDRDRFLAEVQRRRVPATRGRHDELGVERRAQLRRRGLAPEPPRDRLVAGRALQREDRRGRKLGQRFRPRQRRGGFRDGRGLDELMRRGHGIGDPRTATRTPAIGEPPLDLGEHEPEKRVHLGG